MFLIENINFILLLIIFITRTNLLTNQQYIHYKRTIIYPLNSTFKKSFDLNNHRKRRQLNNEFKSDSLKYFTCALVCY